MNTAHLKEAFMGKKILSIIDISLDTSEMVQALRDITREEYDYHEIDNAKLILFENNEAIVFVDFDCDGYRSGD